MVERPVQEMAPGMLLLAFRGPCLVLEGGTETTTAAAAAAVPAGCSLVQE